MTNLATATKINNKANKNECNPKNNCSFGYNRYIVLPDKTRLNLALAHHLDGELDTTFIKTITKFLVDLSELEYKQWIIITV